MTRKPPQPRGLSVCLKLGARGKGERMTEPEDEPEKTPDDGEPWAKTSSGDADSITPDDDKDD
jgi:hypothetical protein